jgi:hypothetical protein
MVSDLFARFLKEKRYVSNLSEYTINSYQNVFKRWMKLVGEMPTEQNLAGFFQLPFIGVNKDPERRSRRFTLSLSIRFLSAGIKPNCRQVTVAP